MRKVKIGDTVSAELFTGEVVTGKVKNIEICEDGDKYGEKVEECNIDWHTGVLDLDCNHWCYFDQVNSIVH